MKSKCIHNSVQSGSQIAEFGEERKAFFLGDDNCNWMQTRYKGESKQVCTNNDAAFQCNFLFNIFFISWMIRTI